MLISTECDFCGKLFRAKPEMAGRKVRCPACKHPCVIPGDTVKSDQDLEIVEDDNDLDLDLPPLPVSRKGTSKRGSAAKATAAEEEILEEESNLPRLSPRRRKKKHKEEEEEEERPVRSVPSYVSRKDLLVWTFLLALIPLAVIVFLPESKLEEKIAKTVEKHPELAEDFAEYSPQEFMEIHRDLSLEGAHLSRRTMAHWAYALVSSAFYAILLTAMLTKSRLKSYWLVLVGLFTGTLGIAMLLAFQIFAEISLHMRFIGGRGLGTIIMILIKFIGFSYRCAMDPNVGFWMSLVGFTCGVGFCEEVCKALPIYYYLRNSDKTDWRGATMLGMASGAGFGISEGIMYSAAYYNGIEPGIIYLVRFASCVAFHSVLSGSVALLMFGNQDYLHTDADWVSFGYGLVMYVLIAMVLHGLYDTLLKQQFNIVALLVAFASFGWMAWLSHQYWNYAPDDDDDE